MAMAMAPVRQVSSVQTPLEHALLEELLRSSVQASEPVLVVVAMALALLGPAQKPQA